MIREMCTVAPHPTDIDRVRISVTCPDCKKKHRFDMLESDWFQGLRDRNAGALMQNAFPNLAHHHRESLISGLCPSCFDEICHD
jgi:hypothetical protein